MELPQNAVATKGENVARVYINKKKEQTMCRIRSLLLLLLFLPGADAFRSSITLEPGQAEVTFANKINRQYVVASEPIGALHIDYVWDPYDRPLSLETFQVCRGREGLISMDHGAREQYVVSCCLNRTCPLPPPPEVDVLRGILFARPIDAWVFRDGPPENRRWERLANDFVYYDPVTVMGVCKRLLAVVVLLAFTASVFSAVAGAMHTGSNRCPNMFIFVHTLSICALAVFVVDLLIKFKPERSYRGALIRAGLVHTLLQLLSSIIVTYTPASGGDGNDMRWRVSGACGRFLVRLARQSSYRKAGALCFAVYMVVGTTAGTVAVWDALWDILDAEFDVLIAIGLAYLICSGVHAVAFITAIYEIALPLRLNGIADARHVKMEEGRVVLCDDGMHMEAERGWTAAASHAYILVHDNEAGSILLWQLGTISETGKIVPFRKMLAERRAFCSCRSTRLKVPGLKQRKAGIFISNARGDLEKVGSVGSHGEFKHDSVARMAQVILRIAAQPDDDCDYTLNVVYNMRHACHTCQRKRRVGRRRCLGGYVYTVFWWLMYAAHCALSMLAIAVFFDARFAWVYAAEIIGLFAFTFFATISGLTRMESEGSVVAPAVIMRGTQVKCCPEGHPLRKAHAPGGERLWMCDVSHKIVPEGTVVLYCEACDWCWDCVQNY